MMKVYTTSQIAKYCHVAPRTVCKWFDSGRLKGYRLPGSRYRRIPKRSFICFLSDNGFPKADELFYEIAVVSRDDYIIRALEQFIICYSDCCRLTIAKSAFEAANMINISSLWCLVIDFDGGFEANHENERALVSREGRKFNLIQVGSDGSCIQRGAEIPEYFRKPFDSKLLTMCIHRLLVND